MDAIVGHAVFAARLPALPSRRLFLKLGFAGAATLAFVRILERPARAQGNASARDLENARILAALVPVILEGALPSDEVAQAASLGGVVTRFERAVRALSPAVRAEVDELFGVFRVAPVRLAFTGLWQPVEESSPAELATFLARWRTSPFDIQRAGYLALTQLVQAAWYGETAAWRAIGYPGPPAL
jgi:hypothetical protein